MRLIIYVIYACAILALMAAAYYWRRVASISIDVGTPEEVAKFKEISGAIQEGAMAFLKAEYTYVAIFVTCFAVAIYFLINEPNSLGINSGLFSAVAFVAGAVTSSLCAFMGMHIATIG